MSHQLTQPEEIDQILKDFAGGDAKAGVLLAAHQCFSKMQRQVQVTLGAKDNQAFNIQNFGVLFNSTKHS